MRQVYWERRPTAIGSLGVYLTASIGPERSEKPATWIWQNPALHEFCPWILDHHQGDDLALRRFDVARISQSAKRIPGQSRIQPLRPNPSQPQSASSEPFGRRALNLPVWHGDCLFLRNPGARHRTAGMRAPNPMEDHSHEIRTSAGGAAAALFFPFWRNSRRPMPHPALRRLNRARSRSKPHRRTLRLRPQLRRPLRITSQLPTVSRPAPAATPQSSAAATAPVADMRPVHAELVSKLDTKTAKTGDDVVAETKGSVKTADGTEIPKGTKLLGHVVAVQASRAGQISQVALAFDHAQLQGGTSLPIQSQIQAIEPPEGSATASAPDEMSRNPGGSAGASASSNGAPGSAGGANSAPAYAPPPTPQAQGGPPAGTVVAHNGKIAIKTTSIPGVLLASNAPGEQDPRMERASGILLGAKKDVQLDGGTQMVLASPPRAGAGGSRAPAARGRVKPPPTRAV